jgi:hypothetical protein
LTLPLRPKRGGFLRPFGCGLFIRDFLLGRGPHGSAKIDPEVGAPQADICYFYKNALRQATALDRSTKLEEKRARRQNRRIDPDNIEKLTASYLARLPYKGFACRAHSFNTYFSTIQKLRWVEFTGKETPSSFQDHYLFWHNPVNISASPQKAGKPAMMSGRIPTRALYGRRQMK